jgi:hypothetical protein
MEAGRGWPPSCGGSALHWRPADSRPRQWHPLSGLGRGLRPKLTVSRPVASATATSWTPATWLTSSVTVIAQLLHAIVGYDGEEPAKRWGRIPPRPSFATGFGARGRVAGNDPGVVAEALVRQFEAHRRSRASATVAAGCCSPSRSRRPGGGRSLRERSAGCPCARELHLVHPVESRTAHRQPLNSDGP